MKLKKTTYSNDSKLRLCIHSNLIKTASTAIYKEAKCSEFLILNLDNRVVLEALRLC